MDQGAVGYPATGDSPSKPDARKASFSHLAIHNKGTCNSPLGLVLIPLGNNGRAKHPGATPHEDPATLNSMTWDTKKEKLKAIYDRYETDAAPFKQHAICKLGCTYCCTDVGDIDTNTLEGLIIWERIKGFPQDLKDHIKDRLSQNRRQKKKHTIAPCSFLQTDKACLIYDVRPFSCRQLYSIEECRGRGPTVHRQAVALAKRAVREMQRLDDTGYSGHLSHILYLLDKASFRGFYLAGGFDPTKIMKFGKTHGIIINRFAR